MSVERKITALIALGVDGLQTAHIPPSVAQECARRWLIEAARDAERERVRALEKAAEAERQAERSARHARVEAARVRAWKWLAQQPERGEMTRYDEGKFIDWATHGGREASEVAWRKVYDEIRADRRAYVEIDERADRTLLSEFSQIVRDGVDAIIEERAANLDMEWTAALLTATVALPDGTRVEWGEATREQHAARLEMLTKHAASEIETAARHRAAIDTLDATGARCLNEVRELELAR